MRYNEASKQTAYNFEELRIGYFTDRIAIKGEEARKLLATPLQLKFPAQCEENKTIHLGDQANNELIL